MSDERPVRCDVDGAVATVTLVRPGGHNGMTTGMVVTAYEVLSELAARHDVRVVVLTGGGDRFFCPGADLAGGPPGDPPVEPRHFHVSVLLHEMPQITVAAVNGSVAGAGLSWACACDLRLATTSARFATAFLDVGVAGDFGLPWSLSRIVGPARARELFLLAGRFDAERAQAIGLVSAVFEDRRFRDEVAEVVGRLAAAPPDALGALKANFVAAERLGFADYIDIETQRHLPLVNGPEFRARARAFVAGRATGSA